MYPGGIYCEHILSWALHWVGLEGREQEGGERLSCTFCLGGVVAKRRGSGRTSWRMAGRMARGKGKRSPRQRKNMCKHRETEPRCTLEAQNHPVSQSSLWLRSQVRPGCKWFGESA